MEGKGFDDLDRTLQRSIITRPITVNKIKKASKSVRYILFKRLNTGGLELTAPEIRNAVYQGFPADTIKRLALLDEFKQATESSIPTKRMEDRDFVSRFIAFYLLDYTSYNPGLDDFINKSLDSINLSNIVRLETDFKKALSLAHHIFGNDAFRKRFNQDDRRKPINKAFFEVITVLFSKLNDNQIDQLKSHQTLFKTNLITLMNSGRYSNSLSGGTGTRDSVNIRFSWFEQVLEMSIAGRKVKISHDNKIENSEF